MEMVHAYHRAGYSGFVLTDHFIFGNTCVSRVLPWKQRMKRYYQAYLDAKEVAAELDFDVFFGLEHAYGNGKELLIYGIDLDFLLANPDIPHISVSELVDRVHNEGGVVIQAHPYRDRFYINMDVEPREDLIDGVEVYNAANSHSENLKALKLAQRINKIVTSGGDVHFAGNAIRQEAGILLPRRVSSSKEFSQALMENNHGFIVNGIEVNTITESSLL